MDTMIGRTKEIGLVSKYMKSGKAEFVALYGRRRVGKTFLVTSYFKNKFDFDVTGIIGGRKEEELEAFYVALKRYGYQGKKPKKWMEVFEALRTLLEAKMKQRKGKRCVVFFDELPCFDTPKSGFVHALDYFWNSWASRQSSFFLVVCGSATSWIVRNIIDNHGGLHGRITHELHLRPFSLKETELFLKKQKSKWKRISVLQAYMILGGIPYYLSMLDVSQSLTENIDRLFFSEDAELRKEYARLYESLFVHSERYMDVIKVLSNSKKGLTRKEIAEKLSIANNGHLSNLLEDLINCDFIRRYEVAGVRVKSNGSIYQLMDFFSFFYLDFVEGRRRKDPHYWSKILNTPAQNTWYGLAYERVCLSHISQILRVLHLDSVLTECYSWRSKNSEDGAQIDIIIDRADDMINICEVKYSREKYSLTKSEYAKILNRVETFGLETNTRKGVHVALITTFGIVENKYSDIAQNVVNLNDMFV